MTAPSATPLPTDADGPTRAGTRASSLPAEERRAAIAAATLPLLVTAGAGITTRQIAEAAGIAEGTIFRVFPDKESVIRAAVELAFDPAPLIEGFEAIDRSLPLEDRLVVAVELLQDRTERLFQLMSTVATMGNASDLKPSLPLRAARDLDALAAIFEPDRALLRRPPHDAAQLLRSVTFGGTHPLFATGGRLSPTEIVSLVLDGVRARPTPTTPTTRKGS